MSEVEGVRVESESMKRVRRLVLAAATVAVATLAIGCGASPSPSPTVCDGIASDAGGCTADRHSFAATTCSDVAREWAVVLDKAVIAVLDGPADVGVKRAPSA